MGQRLLFREDGYKNLDAYIKGCGFKRILLVCGNSISRLKIGEYFNSLEERIGVQVVRFDGFEPNPSYDSVVKGVRLFRAKMCDAVFAVGGGSAIDVAKCIKLFAFLDPARNYLEQEIVPNDITLFAMPTTAGTGSEATRFAAIYYKGEKQSVSDPGCIPDTVLLDESTLETLPLYQKKATMLDALCHGVEAFWSVNSTEESRIYSREAIRLILTNKEGYLNNDKIGNSQMLKAANLAGKAINIAQTTAGHAMCYKLTGLYGVSHGHAAAMCVYELWPYMLSHLHRCVDLRGRAYLEGTFLQLAQVFGCDTPKEAAYIYQNFYDSLGLDKPVLRKSTDYEILKRSVNPVRLKNNPVRLDPEAIDRLYHEILERDV